MKTIEGRGRVGVRAGICALALGGATLVGCGDDTEASSGTGGAGGAGGEAASSSSSSTSTPTSSGGSPASTSTSVGPGGGEGGDGDGGAANGTGGEVGSGGSGSGGEGGAGGASAVCLDSAAFSDLFTLDTDRLCVVALYDAPGWVTLSYGVQPTWGTHGGPLTGAYFNDIANGPITSVELTRWSVPAGTSGEVTPTTTEIALDLGDDADFGGGQFLDLPGDTTIFTYSGEDFTTEGGLVFFDEEGVLETDLLIGGVGIAVDATDGSPLVAALAAPLDTAIDAAGLYGVEACVGGGFVCGGVAHSIWGDATGPVATDLDGNVFAVMTSFDGTQTARGFGPGELSTDELTDGADAFTVGGFGSPLAAIAPLAGEPGLLVFQATNAETYAGEPAIVATYEADGDSVTPGEAPETLLTPTVDGAPISLVSDDEDRIWVGVGTETGTRFAVLARP